MPGGGFGGLSEAWTGTVLEGGDRLCERFGGDVVSVTDLAEVQGRVGLGGHFSISEPENDRDSGHEIARRQSDRHVDQIVGGHGRHYRAVVDTEQFKRGAIITSADRHRDPCGQRKPHARRVWDSLDRDDGNAAPLQLLGEPEADLPEADQQHVSTGGNASGTEQGGQARTAEPSDERRGEGSDERERGHVSSAENSLNHPDAEAALGASATVATERVLKYRASVTFSCSAIIEIAACTTSAASRPMPVATSNRRASSTSRAPWRQRASAR